jgi:TusA-related sulfurtransferase
MLEQTLYKIKKNDYQKQWCVTDRRSREDRRNQFEVMVHRTLDARGAYCPGPLMELIWTMKREPVGTVIEVLSSDPGSNKEIPYWISRVGQVHIGTREIDGYWSIVVKKIK